MPFASVEDWRARIGSCWCVLGRPFKSKSSGNHQSHAHISGRAMLQAVNVLTLILVLGVKNINQYITECQRQLKNNFRPCSKRVLMILILLLQAISFIQSSLLLKCGDVESNPGPELYPDLDYDNVDSSTVLTEDDFREVFGEAMDVHFYYYHFGIYLGLPQRELNAIRTAFSNNFNQAFCEIILVWLKHRYNIEKHGPPTWRRLVEAVDSPAGGNNHALAKRIAGRHPSATEENPASESDHALATTDANHIPKGSEALFQRCRGTMAAYYLKQVDDRAWPPVKATNFINLALIKDQTSWRKTVQESVDEIVGDKATTSYKSIINDHCIGTFTLLEGRPGSGKTVLMNKISCDWAKGEILKSSLLIFIPLRRLGAELDRKLATLLKVACSALPQSDIKEMVTYIERTQGERVIFAFDGFDEYVPYHYEIKVPVTRIIEETVNRVSISYPPKKKKRWYDIFRRKRQCVVQECEITPIVEQKKTTEFQSVEVEDIFEMLKGKNLTKSTIFVTSRPNACNSIREYAGKRIEVLGFLKPQIVEYVHYYFGTDKQKAQQLVTHLEHHPNLMNMAYLPLHCAMLTFLYEDGTVLPETETEFYKHFTLSTLLRSIRRKQGSITTITSYDQLPHREKITFDKVCTLAFNATVKSKQVFTSADIESILPDTDSTHARNDVSDLGLIVTDHYFMRFGLDDTYTFLHLTFQEYLAAVYIAGLSESERMNIIQKYKYAGNFLVVWRYLCGMMDFSSTNTMDTFENLMNATKDKLLKIQCCYETQHSSPCRYVMNAFNRQLEFNSNNFTPSDCTAIGWTINRSDLYYLTFERCNFSSEGALTLLQQLDDHPLSLNIEMPRGTCTSSFLDGFRQCPATGLYSLNLSRNSIGDVGAQVLAEGLKHCTNMKELNLSDNSIDDTGVEALLESVKYSTSLKKLILSGNRIQAHDGVWVVGRGLQEFHLSRNSIDDIGAQKLGEALRHHGTIRKLIMEWNPITASGLQTLIEHLKRCSNLQELNFWYSCSISDDAVPCLIEAIQTFKNLERLRLDCSHFTKSGIQRISSAITERNNSSDMVQLNLFFMQSLGPRIIKL